MAAPFVWFDLTATPDDADRAREFYSQLLGWTIGPDSDPGPYSGWIMDGEQPWAAVVESAESTAGRWLPYVPVADLDRSVETATALGATIVGEKTNGPAGTSVTISGPGGALIALWTPYPDKP